MNIYNYLNLILGAWRKSSRLLSSSKGNVLVYLIVVVLIFGVLGVTMVSLFTTATTSSATPNDARRAYYVAESGIRYALSEIRNSNFNDNFIQSLNSQTYTLNDGGSFTINIFSPFFISESDQITPGGDIFTLSVPNSGKIPQEFDIPVNIFAINWFNFDDTVSDSFSQVNSSTVNNGDTSLTITLNDDFKADKDDVVCLAVNPTATDASLDEGDSLHIAIEAAQFFPPRNGAIRILDKDANIKYDGRYEERIVDTSNNRVTLTNLAALPGGGAWSSFDLASDDYVILSRYNYRIISTGTSGDVSVEIGNDKPLNIFGDAGVYTIYMEDLVADAEVKETGPLFAIDAGEDKKIIIGPETPPAENPFGALWYGGEKPIGGDSTFCEEGRCRFGDGIRAFFRLDVDPTSNSEGFIFALISAGGEPPENTINSVGGDAEQSELLGYAGDSRENPGGLPFLDGTLDGKGLLPPKIGLEFDTRTNNNEPLQYCQDATTLLGDTRNDPFLPGDNPTHAVQNVFWGDTQFRANYILCRQDDATYDDNRHEAEDFRQKWIFDTPTLPIISSPAIGDVGTIYVGSDDGQLYAVNPDDRERHFNFGDRPFPTESEWIFPNAGSIGAVQSSPAIGDDGTIYVGSNDGHLYAVSPDGSPKWQFPDPLSIGAVQSSPAIDNNNTPADSTDDTIYVGSNDGRVYAINPDGSSKGLNWPFDTLTGGPLMSSPAIDLTGGLHNGTIYIGAGTQGTDDDGKLIAINPDGTQKWVFLAEGLGDDDMDSSPAVGSDGTIYIGSDDGNLYAVNPGDGSRKWRIPTVSDIESKPAVSNSTVYVESENIMLYALNTVDGATRWVFPLGGWDDGNIESSPSLDILDIDGTVYIGSRDTNVRAINPDERKRHFDFGDRPFPTESEWIFSTGAEVRSTPAINSRDKTVYVGSSNSNLYAFNQIAEPRNFKDESIEDKKLIISDDFPLVTFTDAAKWLKDGPWGVRMEVSRGTTPDTDGNCTYTLNTWVEQCQSSDCSDLLSLNFRDTTVVYEVLGRPPKLEQTIEISCTDPDKFERFLFGFTTAASAGDTQQAIIRNFELTFTRPGDQTVDAD